MEHPPFDPPPLGKNPLHDRRLATPVSPVQGAGGVRAADLEPHDGLRYVARLFKVLALLMGLLLIAEVAVTLSRQGSDAFPLVLVEATRLLVLVGFLWGAGDMAILLIESNHDLRANRILLGRLNGKLQRILELEADEVELLAGNPSLRPLSEPGEGRRGGRRTERRGGG